MKYVTFIGGDELSLSIINDDSFDELTTGKTFIELSKNVFEAISIELSAGKVIAVDNGRIITKPKYHELPSIDQIKEALVEVRNLRLKQTDWTQLPDSPMHGNEHILKYRQALRDITTLPDFPFIFLPLEPIIRLQPQR